MSNNEVKLIFTGDSRRLEKALTRSNKKIQSFSDKSVNAFRRVGKSAGRVSKKIGGVMKGIGRLGALLGIASLGMAVKGLVDFDAKLARLKIQAGLTNKKMLALRGEILKTAKDTNQMPFAILEGIEAIVERTGNLKFAVGSMKDMGIISSATGAEMKDIGYAASDLQEKMGATKNDLIEFFDILAGQGKGGAYTLMNMASEFKRLLPAATGIGIKGKEGMRSFGAFVQLVARGTGGPEETTTTAVGILSEIAEKIREIKKLTGFSVLDEEKSKKANRAIFKDFEIILKELISRTNGDITKLQKIFGREAMKGIYPIVDAYIFSGFKDFDKLKNMKGDGAMIKKDYADWMETTAAKAKEVQIDVDYFTKENLKEPVDILADVPKGLKKLYEEFGGTSKLPNPAGALTFGFPVNPLQALSKVLLQNLAEYGNRKDVIAPVVENYIDLNISVDGNDRVTTTINNMNTKVGVNLKRGHLNPGQ